MLILQRKIGEAIRIGDDITIRISEIGSERVKIAIDAPRELAIVREELLTATQTNMQAAAAKPNLAVIHDLLLHETKQKSE